MKRITNILTKNKFIIGTSLFIFAILFLIPLHALADQLDSVCNNKTPSGVITQVEGVVSAKIFTTLMSPIATISGKLFMAANQFAKTIFFTLATIQVVWFIYEIGFAKMAIEDFFHQFGVKIIGIMIGFSIIMTVTANQGAWVRSLVFGDFSSLGAQIGSSVMKEQGQDSKLIILDNSALAKTVDGKINPDAKTNGGSALENIAASGGCVYFAMTMYPFQETWAEVQKDVAKGGILAIGSIIEAIPITMANFLFLSINIPLGIFCALVFFFISLKMVAVIIDGLIGLGAGALLLGLGGIGNTLGLNLGIGQGYIKNVLTIGSEALAINLIAGFGIGFVRQQINEGIDKTFLGTHVGAHPMSLLFTVPIFFDCVILLFLVMHSSKIANSIATGGPITGMGAHAIETVVGAGVGLAKIAATIAAGPGAGAAVGAMAAPLENSMSEKGDMKTPNPTGPGGKDTPPGTPSPDTAVIHPNKNTTPTPAPTTETKTPSTQKTDNDNSNVPEKELVTAGGGGNDGRNNNSRENLASTLAMIGGAVSSGVAAANTAKNIYRGMSNPGANQPGGGSVVGNALTAASGLLLAGNKGKGGPPSNNNERNGVPYNAPPTKTPFPEVEPLLDKDAYQDGSPMGPPYTPPPQNDQNDFYMDGSPMGPPYTPPPQNDQNDFYMDVNPLSFEEEPDINTLTEEQKQERIEKQRQMARDVIEKEKLRKLEDLKPKK